MKRKFSLNALLHNERVMLIVSLIAAIGLWALISFGPGNIQERTITVTQKIDLAGTIAGYNDLRVIGEDTFEVRVTVKGARSVIFNLNADDLSISPSLSDIQGVGTSRVALSATKVKAGDYNIIAVSPSSITLNCDYWVSKPLPLSTDVNSISPKEDTQRIGELRIDSDVVSSDGQVHLEGPQTVVNRVVSILAKTEETVTIDKTTSFTAKLIAYDADGKEVDIRNCRVTGANADNTLDITVPVWVQKKVELTYHLLNKPEGLSDKGLVTLNPSSVTLVGEPAALDAAAATIANIGSINFDQLKPSESEKVINLNVTGDIKVMEGNTVTVQLAIGNYTTKTLSYSVNSLADISVINEPNGKTFALTDPQKISDIVLCGSKADLNHITAKDLKVTVNAAGTTGRYEVRITVPSQKGVWVYYGNKNYSLFGQLK